MTTSTMGAWTVPIVPITPIAYAPEEAPSDQPPRTLRLLVIAGDPLARMGLASLVGALPGCRVVGDFSFDTDLADVIERLDPDLLVWDLGHTGAVPEDRDLGDATPPVLLLAPREFLGSLSGPAWSVVLRDTDGATLAAAINAAASGLIVLDPAFSKPVAASRERAAVELSEALTPREVEVLQSLAAGLPNKLIAERLGISEHTVRFHLNAIFGKLDAHTRTEAVSRAARLGLIVL